MFQFNFICWQRDGGNKGKPHYKSKSYAKISVITTRKKGHYKRDLHSKRKIISRLNQEVINVMLWFKRFSDEEVIYENVAICKTGSANAWILDLGASHHMIYNHDFF